MPLNAYPITEPIVEPVTLALAKQQCRIDPALIDDDALVNVYIGAARGLVEKVIQGSLFNRIWLRSIDGFPLSGYDAPFSPADRGVAAPIINAAVIDLPGGRVRRIVSITYLDENGAEVVADPTSYRADLASIPARITPPSQVGAWPWLGQFEPGSVRITYEVANYTAAVTGETFTAPPASGGLSTYQLAKSWATGLERLVDGAGNAVAGAVLATDAASGNSSLTLPAALAGQALTVDYDVQNLPKDVMNALLLLIAHFYRNPEATSDLKLAEVPLSAMCLLEGHVITWGDYRPC